MRIVVDPMELEDIPQVQEVDRESYSLPWPASTYRREIMHNSNARYLVVREVRNGEEDQGANREAEQRPRLAIPFFRIPSKSNEAKRFRSRRVLGYAGMWIMVNEAHITTVALRSNWRGKGFGELLLASLVELAAEMGADRVTLEVRVSNEVARNLYRKYGFQEEGRRPRYYSDDNEDAFIMTTSNIQDAQYRRQFDSLVTELRNRLQDGGGDIIAAPAFPEADLVERVQEAD